MKRARLFAVLGAALLFVLVGCGQQGYITVENNTNDLIWASVDGDEEQIGAHDDNSWEFEFPGFLLDLIKQETQTIDVAYGGLFVFSDGEEVELEAGQEVTVEVDPDAGAIFIHNNSSNSIDVLQLSSNGGTTWTSNLVSSNWIGPGYTRPYTVSPGTWLIYAHDTGGWYVNLEAATLPQPSVGLQQAYGFQWNGDNWSLGPEAAAAAQGIAPSLTGQVDPSVRVE